MGIARNTIYNLFGMVIPILAAIISAPILINHFGLDRYGILTLAWLVVGYFSLFDFGLSRATTKVVAEQIGQGREDGTPGTIIVALLLMTALGIAGGLLIYSSAEWLVYDLLKVPDELKAETLRVFHILAFAIPFIVQTTGFRGVLEAYQQFRISSMLNAGLGTFTYAGPLLAILFADNLIVVAWVLLIGRLVFWLLYLLSSEHTARFLARRPAPQWGTARSLVSFGGWIALSNLISPLMVTFDRFFVGVLISTSMIAYYATPLDAASKLVIIAQAVAGVLFPAFATGLADNPQGVPELFMRGVRWVYIAISPAVLFLVLFASLILQLWLGEDFVRNSTSILQLIALGAMLNSFAVIPFALIQSAGRPDITAFIHLGELPVYLLLLYVLAVRIGIVGVALAWLLRMVVDVSLLYFFARKQLVTGNEVMLRIVKATLIAVALVLVAFMPMTLALRVVYLGGAGLLLLAAAWSFLMSDLERQALFHQVRSIVTR